MRKSLLFLTAVFIFTACKDDVAEEKYIPSANEMVLVINGDKGSLSTTTRVSYSGFSSAFETGDAVGVYCWDGSSYVSSNVKFTRQSDGSWTPSSRVPYNSSYTYFCYCPWRSDHGYTPTSSGTVDNRFATFITDAENKFWVANQSTKANFDASNLLISQGTHVGSGNAVSFTMDHKRGLAVFEGDGLGEKTFTGNIPYAITGSRKIFLMKPSTSTSIGGWSLTAAAGKYVMQNVPYTYNDFILTVSGTAAYTYAGGTNSYSVTSYKTSTGGGSNVAVAWTATYSTDGGSSFSSTKPSWLTAFTASGAGGTSATTYNSTVAAQSAVIGTLSDTYAARSCVVKISQNEGTASRTFTVTQNAFTDTYTFYLTVSGPAAYDYTGGTKSYSVTSYKQNTARTTAVAWTATYSTDGGSSYSSTKPSWITTFTATGSGGTSASAYNATVAAQTPTSTASQDVYAARSCTVKISQNEGTRNSTFNISQSAYTYNKTVIGGDITIPDWTE